MTTPNMPGPDPAAIPDDMPCTDPEPAHAVDGWEVLFDDKPEQGVLRVSHVPGSPQTPGLFICKGMLMFPLAYFKNWHAAHRFVSWMERRSEPEPTLAAEYAALMAHKLQQAEHAPGIEAEIKQGKMEFRATDTPITEPTPGLPRWPADKEEGPDDSD